jgi:hypothetical protein
VEFILGLITGLVITIFLSWLITRRELLDYYELNKRLKYLERHLCCGKGIFGCDGGANCKWDHK